LKYKKLFNILLKIKKDNYFRLLKFFIGFFPFRSVESVGSVDSSTLISSISCISRPSFKLDRTLVENDVPTLIIEGGVEDRERYWGGLCGLVVDGGVLEDGPKREIRFLAGELDAELDRFEIGDIDD
jgi:hypothetical protein